MVDGCKNNNNKAVGSNYLGSAIMDIFMKKELKPMHLTVKIDLLIFYFHSPSCRLQLYTKYDLIFYFHPLSCRLQLYTKNDLLSTTGLEKRGKSSSKLITNIFWLLQ